MALDLSSALGPVKRLPFFDVLVKGTIMTYNKARDAIMFNVSIGESRSATKVEISETDLPDVLSVLESWDPETTVERVERPVHEIIGSTLSVDREKLPEDAPEGTVGKVVSYSFKMSDKPHTREVTIPVEDWDDFLRYIARLNDAATSDVRENVRKVQEEEDRAHAARLAKRAENAAKKQAGLSASAK